MKAIEIYSNNISFKKIVNDYIPEIYREVINRDFPMVVVPTKTNESILDAGTLERFNLSGEEEVIITVFQGNEMIEAFSINDIEKKKELIEMIKKETGL